MVLHFVLSDQSIQEIEWTFDTFRTSLWTFYARVVCKNFPNANKDLLCVKSRNGQFSLASDFHRSKNLILTELEFIVVSIEKIKQCNGIHKKRRMRSTRLSTTAYVKVGSVCVFWGKHPRWTEKRAKYSSRVWKNEWLAIVFEKKNESVKVNVSEWTAKSVYQLVTRKSGAKNYTSMYVFGVMFFQIYRVVLFSPDTTKKKKSYVSHVSCERQKLFQYLFKREWTYFTAYSECPTTLCVVS